MSFRSSRHGEDACPDGGRSRECKAPGCCELQKVIQRWKRVSLRGRREKQWEVLGIREDEMGREIELQHL